MSDRLSVLVCRGCCCGTSKHPDVDHVDQVATLRAHLPDRMRARLFEVGCLGVCSHSNVVVVRRGNVRRWFGGVLLAETAAALAGWIRGGACGSPPAPIATHEFHPEVPQRLNVTRI